MIKGEWSAFNEILKCKDATIQSQVASLSHKIVQESKPIEQKMLNDWKKGRQYKYANSNIEIVLMHVLHQLFIVRVIWLQRMLSQLCPYMKEKIFRLEKTFPRPRKLELERGLNTKKIVLPIWTSLSA